MGSYCGWLGVMAIPWLRVVFAEENLGFSGREIWHFIQTVSAAFVPVARAERIIRAAKGRPPGGHAYVHGYAVRQNYGWCWAFGCNFLVYV